MISGREREKEAMLLGMFTQKLMVNPTPCESKGAWGGQDLQSSALFATCCCISTAASEQGRYKLLCWRLGLHFTQDMSLLHMHRYSMT